MKLNEFIQRSLCEGKEPSSKRLAGIIGWITCQIIIIAAVVISFIMTNGLVEGLIGLIDFDMATSAALLGLATITRAFAGNQTSIGKEKTDEE